MEMVPVMLNAKMRMECASHQAIRWDRRTFTESCQQKAFKRLNEEAGPEPQASQIEEEPRRIIPKSAIRANQKLSERGQKEQVAYESVKLARAQ